MGSSNVGDSSEVAEEEMEGAKEYRGKFASEGVYGAEWRRCRRGGGAPKRGRGDRWGRAAEKEKEEAGVWGYGWE